MGPLVTPFGRFDFDLFGPHRLRLLRWSCCCRRCSLARRLVHSPFGVSLQALRDNRLRAASIGLVGATARWSPSTRSRRRSPAPPARCWRRPAASPRSTCFDFHRTADVLLVLVIGGTGYLYGGIFGAIVFKLLHDLISAWTPQYWKFWLGLFLVVLVLVGRERFVRPVDGWFAPSGATSGA